MSSDDNKFPFLNNDSDSGEDFDSKSSKENTDAGKESNLLPWQKKSFGKKNRRSDDKGGREDRRPSGDGGGDNRRWSDRRDNDSRGGREDRRSSDDGGGENKRWSDRRDNDNRGGREDRRSSDDGGGENKRWSDRRDNDSRGGREDRRSSDDGGGDNRRWSDRRDNDSRGGSQDRSKNRSRTTDRRDTNHRNFDTNDDMQRYDKRENDFKPARIQSTKSESFQEFANFYLRDDNEVEKPLRTENRGSDQRSERKSSTNTDGITEGRRKRLPRDLGLKRRNEVKDDGEQGQSSAMGSGPMRLNKFIAKTGLCSRRAAADLVKAGEILVNDKVEDQPAYEVQDTDVIKYQGKVLKIEEELVYLLLNKPKGYITTLDDEKDRKTVMELVEDKVDVRIYPVGRLDRNTSGLLLFTNDGDLTKVLSHPSHKVQKFYHVVLDRPVSEDHLEQIRAGLTLEDGLAEVDAVGYIDGKGKDEVGIEIHIGKNRIVRRLFEHFGYRVEKLDRTYYAGLTKKDLSRGWSRNLTHKEVIMLKHFTGK